MTTSIPCLRFVPGLPTEELHAELELANTVTSLGRRKLARYLADMEIRGVYVETGHGDAAHYATARLGMKRRSALDYILTGRRLEELPEIDAALCEGEISWSKAKVLVRIAVQETQKDWLEYADDTNCDKLSADVARGALGDRPPRGQGGLPEIRIVVRASLNLINHELWDQAKRKLSAEMRMQITNEDMIIQVARLILATDADGMTEGRSRVLYSPFQLVIHQGEEGTFVHTSHGDVQLRPEQASRLAEQADVISAPQVAEQSEAELPDSMRRFVLARDHFCCTNCRGAQGLQVHHIQFRSMGGGHAAQNLASLCARCHSMIHSGLLVVRRSAEGELVFRDKLGFAVNEKRPEIEANRFVQMLPLSGDATHLERISNSMMLARARREPSPSPATSLSWMVHSCAGGVGPNSSQGIGK